MTRKGNFFNGIFHQERNRIRILNQCVANCSDFENSLGNSERII